jgi:hypothetical protein
MVAYGSTLIWSTCATLAQGDLQDGLDRKGGVIAPVQEVLEGKYALTLTVDSIVW